MSPLTEALGILGLGRSLTASQVHGAVAEIMGGEASEVAIGAFLTALKVKGETAEELEGAVAAIRERSTQWGEPDVSATVIDTCGTGGDGANTVNISTATAIVVAACGVPVVKHGNRSASGNSGSAEVLTELGVKIDAELDILRRCLSELGITFLFAPKFHPALRFAGPVRRLLPYRTLFNIVGPLANPARPGYQLIGVPNRQVAELMAKAIARLGIVRAAIVVGAEGLDEVGLGGPNSVLWVENQHVSERTWLPEDFGLAHGRSSDLRVSGPVESAAKLRAMLAGEAGPVRNTVLANSAAALLVAGRAASLVEGVARAGLAIDEGAAARLLDRWAGVSHGA